MLWSGELTLYSMLMLHLSFILFYNLQVKKAQFGHFKKYGVNPKKKMKSFLVTRNALLHPGKKAIDTIDKKKVRMFQMRRLQHLSSLRYLSINCSRLGNSNDGATSKAFLGGGKGVCVT